jgi:hypothetical protein
MSSFRIFSQKVSRIYEKIYFRVSGKTKISTSPLTARPYCSYSFVLSANVLDIWSLYPKYSKSKIYYRHMHVNLVLFWIYSDTDISICMWIKYKYGTFTLMIQYEKHMVYKSKGMRVQEYRIVL